MWFRLPALGADFWTESDLFARVWLSGHDPYLNEDRLFHYPPQAPVSDDKAFGVAPHSDYGCITLLWQDDNGGLQVRSAASKSWIDAPPIPGTLVINVGDLLARWTNGRFSSTQHRVINRSGRERYSIATFFDPNFSTVVDPRELGTADADCRYEPVRAGDYILGRFDQSFGYRKKLAAAGTSRDLAGPDLSLGRHGRRS